MVETQLRLASLLARHVMAELIPSSRFQSVDIDPFSAILSFTIKDPMNESFREHIENRINELSYTSKLMIEHNAKSYLRDRGEKAAKELSPNSDKSVYLLELPGTIMCSKEELGEEKWPIKVLDFSERDGIWMVRIVARKTAKECDEAVSLYEKNKDREFRKACLPYRTQSGVWTEAGIDAKLALRCELRKIYNACGIHEIEGEPTSGCYRMGEFGDEGFILGEHARQQAKALLDETKIFFESCGMPVTLSGGKVTKICTKDLFGTEWELSKVRIEEHPTGTKMLSNLFLSVERIFLLGLERKS